MALLVDPLGAAAQDPDPEGPSNAQNLEGWHLEDHRVAGTIQRRSARGTNVAGGRSKGKRVLSSGRKKEKTKQKIRQHDEIQHFSFQFALIML